MFSDTRPVFFAVLELAPESFVLFAVDLDVVAPPTDFGKQVVALDALILISCVHDDLLMPACLSLCSRIAKSLTRRLLSCSITSFAFSIA